jgi:hypothetical protein
MVQLLPPISYVKVQHMQTVCGGGGWGEGVELCWRPYSTEVNHSEYDQIQDLQNFYHPKQKLWRGGASDR